MGELKDIVFPFTSEALKTHVGLSEQADYLLRYLMKLDSKTCVIETNYIDKDFLIDYQSFYCRSFDEISKITSRIHFFSMDFSSDQLEDTLVNSDESFMRKLNETYLGFIIIRPIKGSKGQPIIGRTLLKTYPPEGKRHFVTSKYYPSLFGIELNLDSLPFQAKDEGVSACATIALWSALHPLRDLFEITRHAPAEITERSTTIPNIDRRFPQNGLTIEQIVNYIRIIGLDMEVIRPSKNDDYTQTALKAYLDAGLPILAALNLEKSGFQYPLKHAVAISGYKIDKNNDIEELYVHDDVVGPYCNVKKDGTLSNWDYEWKARGFKITLDKLLVPIHPKIRTVFWRMYTEYNGIRKKTLEELERQGEKSNDHDVELLLMTSRKYKEYILKNKKFENKASILMLSLPKFVWIVRFLEKGQPAKDIVYDSTSVYPREIIAIRFH